MSYFSFHLQLAFWLTFLAFKPLWNFIDAGTDESGLSLRMKFTDYYDRDHTLDNALDQGFTRLINALVWAAKGQWHISSLKKVQDFSLPNSKSWLRSLSRDHIGHNALVLTNRNLMLPA